MIEARALTIEQLFLSGVFEPARIQRSYSWTERECAALLDDLERAFRVAGLDPDPDTAIVEADPEEAEEEAAISSEPVEPSVERAPLKPKPARRNIPYFLGQIVLMPREDKASFFVFDGQQRLTSLTILLSVLRDQMRDSDWLPLQEMLRTKDLRRARLTAPTLGGNLARISGSLGGSEEARAHAGRSPADKLLWRACATFQERCAPWSDAKRRAFVTYVRSRVTVTVTTIADRGLAEAAYQTTNTRGRPLGGDDIVKGYLVELVGRQSAQLANTLAQAWDQLKRGLGGQFERFIEAAFFLENYGVDERGYAVGIMDAFEDEGGAERALRWVGQDLPNYAEAWRALAEHFRQNPSVGPNLHLRRLSFIGWTHWTPVAMRMALRDANAPKRFLNAMRDLERWCFVMNLLGHSEARISEACGRAIEQIDQRIDPFRYRTHDDQARTGALYIPKSYKDRVRANLKAPIEDVQRLGAHVRWLETLHWPDALPHAPTNDTSVEHILPRNPTGAWTEVFPPDKIAIYTDLIGNLCLLPKSLNWDLGNGQYPEKRAAYAALPELHRSAREAALAEAWNMEAVDKRTDDLAKRTIAALRL